MKGTKIPNESLAKERMSKIQEEEIEFCIQKYLQAVKIVEKAI